MADVREVVTDWSTIAGSGFVSVEFFDTSASIAAQRTALNAFFASVAASLNNTARYSIRVAGRTLDSASGTLTGGWTDGTAHSAAGSGTVAAIPDAAQVLFRWNTFAIINGRVLKGRTFIPALEISAIAGGNIGNTFVGLFNGYAQALCASATGFGVWHRPVLGAGGSHHVATAGSVWPELAVLRRRRQ